MKRTFFALMLATGINTTHYLVCTNSSEQLWITGEDIRETVLQLNPLERKLLERFLKEKLVEASSDFKEYFEDLLTHFYKGMFDLVLIELKSLGENPQEILHITGLREDLLLGKLEKTPWFIKAVAALPGQYFETNKDKLIYLESILDAFRRAHSVPDITQAIDALFMLAKEFFSCKEDLPPIFLTRLIKDLDDIQELIQELQSQR